MKVFAEINEKGDRIAVYFPYSPKAVAAIKGDPSRGEEGVPGRRFVPKESGGPHWTVPLDLVTGTRLREAFGRDLVLGDALKAWGRDEVQKQRNLRSLARANFAELENLPKRHPELFKYVSTRPYQTADIALMAQTNVGNFNQPGTGKTIETIASWFESGAIDEGPHLVIAPVMSLDNVWYEELEWYDQEMVFTDENPALRIRYVKEGVERALKNEPVVICINPDMIRPLKIWDHKKDSDKEKPPSSAVAMSDYKGNKYAYRNELHAKLCQVDWSTITIDEFHKHGMPNRNSLFSIGVRMLRSKRRAALSGTPMGGRPRRLWAILNWLEPDEYSSEWTWIYQWLSTQTSDWNDSKIVGGIAEGREDAFYEAHARHIVRRLKRDALPGLPPQVHIAVKCSMTPAQKKQYDTFAADAEIRIEEERLSATSILAEYSRLKQFANAKQELRNGVPFPTQESGKLPQLMEKLDEEGIRKVDPEPRARAIIASESARMVKMVSEFLTKQGIKNDMMTGETKDRKSIIKRFKSKNPAPYVIVMTIQTGGVSLNLEEAGSMHALDETWNPDDLEQFFDRGDRGSRTEPLRCYVYRSKGTIQEYIADVAEGKRVTNKNVLDIRRQMFHERD